MARRRHRGRRRHTRGMRRGFRLPRTIVCRRGKKPKARKGALIVKRKIRGFRYYCVVKRGHGGRRRTRKARGEGGILPGFIAL